MTARGYVLRELARNPRRALASAAGVVLGVGLFSGVLFFIDGSGASMTARAIAPVPLDLQRILTAPLGEVLDLRQQVAPGGALRAGQAAWVTLTVRNRGPAPADEVVVTARPGPSLAYVAGSASRDGRPLRDVGGASPFAHGPGRIGLNLGRLGSRATTVLRYRARARRTLPGGRDLGLRATVSSSAQLVPIPANRPALVGQAQLRERVAQVPGVASADELGFADLGPGSLRSGGRRVPGPVRAFGFAPAYAEHYPSIRLAAGALDPCCGVLSAEAARALGAGIGDTVALALPGGGPPLELRVSGIADLSAARQLFDSRRGKDLEEFVYKPYAVVLSPERFRRAVVGAFRRAGGSPGGSLQVSSPPVLEVDVRIGRARLASDPATALGQSRAVARAVRAIASAQDYQLDNVSNALAVARADSATAKRMFLFLGLPGLLLAAFAAAYAAAILAAAQRREHAILRLRGAAHTHLRRLLAWRTAAIAGIGSVLGTAVGLVSALAVLGGTSLREAAPARLAASAALAIAAGVAVTALALYLPARRSLGRELSGERRELELERAPAWQRAWLDVTFAVAAVAAAVLAVRLGAFDAPAGSVRTGTGTSLAGEFLVLPLAVCLAGALVWARLAAAIAGRLPVPAAQGFGPAVRGLLLRGLRRRRRALLTGVLGVALVSASGMGVAVFAATYDATKAADAEFTVGSSLRVTPTPLSRRSHPVAYGRSLRVDGVASVTPVIARRDNAFVRSAFNSDVKTLAAIDPRRFAQTAALSDSFFADVGAAGAMRALSDDPRAILLDQRTADDLKLEVGDRAEVLLARGSKRQRLERMRVAGLFDRLPGFPEGLHVVANLRHYQERTATREVDFFLARATDTSGPGLAAARAALLAGPARRDRLDVTSAATALNRDQSSLTALNVRSLVSLDSFYTLLISTAVIASFVFGTMLQRRREYVTLRAQGLAARELQLLMLGEAAFVALGGLAGGLLVGGGTGLLLVQVLAPLFILPPVLTFPAADAGLLAALIAAATAVSALAAAVAIGRLRPSEGLRDQ